MVQINDIELFESAFRKNYAILCMRACRFVQDETIAETIVQDIFYNLWTKRTEVEIHTSVEAYLHATTINYTLNFLEKRSNLYNRENTTYNQLLNHNSNQKERKYTEEDSTNIQAFLARLPEDCRTVFVLSRFENLSYKAIALQLNISVETVAHEMGKALSLLRI